MTLLRLIQRASILAGMTLASLSIHSNPARADTPQVCVIASNGKTACGTLQLVERACIITDSNNTVCGKFKSATGSQQQQEVRQPVQGNGSRIVVNNVAFSPKGCNRSDTTVKCAFSIRNKGAERTFSTSQSTITDSLGKTYRASSVEMGGQTSIYPIQIIIAPEIEYEAILTFENVP